MDKLTGHDIGTSAVRNLAVDHDLRLGHRRATPSAQAARTYDALVAGKTLHRDNSKNL